MGKIVQRGAEAVLYMEKGKLVKERIAKGYRIPDLDRKIRRQRTKGEGKLMERSRGRGLPVPVAGIEGDFRIVMDYIKGKRLKDVLNKMDQKERAKVCGKIGEMIAGLHANGIIHGDLTTSNMILRGNEIFLVDFGLGKFSEKVEDQAVDLFLLYEALKSTHFSSLSECWKKIVNSYSRNAKSKEVVQRMEKIKKRRRYK